MCDNKFSWKKRAKSFVFAFAGIKIVLKNEHNAWIHLLIASLVLIFGLIFNLSSLEWVAILLCIGIVFMAEAFNTSIETLADRVNSEQDPMIKKTKDVAAGAVLIVAVISVIVGLIIFIPKFIEYFI